MRITPKQDQILVRLDPFEGDFYGTGIVRPDTALDKPHLGTVIARGPGRYHGKSLTFRPTTVASGDRVVIPWATGLDIKADGDRLVLLRESDIIATIERTEHDATAGKRSSA